MSKEKQTEEQSDKVVTRYDRRMEKRKKWCYTETRYQASLHRIFEFLTWVS